MMKKLLFSCAIVLVSLSSFSQQVDSSRIPQTITLSEYQHTYLVSFMENITSADKINYLNQLRAAYDTSNMRKPITVSVTSQLILSAYAIMTVQPEGWTSTNNNDIKAALVPQITNPWLGTQLAAIMADNQAQTDIRVKRAKSFIMSIN